MKKFITSVFILILFIAQSHLWAVCLCHDSDVTPFQQSDFSIDNEILSDQPPCHQTQQKTRSAKQSNFHLQEDASHKKTSHQTHPCHSIQNADKNAIIIHSPCCDHEAKSNSEMIVESRSGMQIPELFGIYSYYHIQIVSPFDVTKSENILDHFLYKPKILPLFQVFRI